MTTYKLTYFNIMGLGEPIRYMLSYLGKDFEDDRVDVTDLNKWTTDIKPLQPFGKLPVLETGTHKLTQSKAICRYFAIEAKLEGSNAFENLQIDIIMDTWFDFFSTIWAYRYCEDEKYKEHLKGPLYSTTIPFYLGKFDKIIEEGGYLANGKLSWADLFVVSIIEYLVHVLQIDVAKEYPHIGALQTKVNAIPNIKAWREKRPKSDW